MRSPAIFVQSVCCPCPQLYSSLPVPCRAALRRPRGFLFSATSAFSAPSALTLLLASCYLFAVICYPLCPGNQPIFLPPKKKRRKLSPPPSIRSKFLSGAFLHLGRLRSFGSLYYVKFDRITLLQRPVAIPGDCRIVYEYIGPIFPAYESVSFRIIEPLYCSLHFVSPLDGDSGGGKPRRAAMSTNCAECIKLDSRVKKT